MSQDLKHGRWIAGNLFSTLTFMHRHLFHTWVTLTFKGWSMYETSAYRCLYGITLTNVIIHVHKEGYISNILNWFIPLYSFQMVFGRFHLITSKSMYKFALLCLIKQIPYGFMKKEVIMGGKKATRKYLSSFDRSWKMLCKHEVIENSSLTIKNNMYGLYSRNMSTIHTIY